MKIVLKGVGTADDAVRALEAGCDGVVLSNHGGRQLDFARSGIEVLPEAMAALRAHPRYSPAAFEVFVDGGVRRGTDVFKALALGATAVGVGRPALYAMASFGAAGVAKMIQILKNELEMTMRLMGTPTLADISEKMVRRQLARCRQATRGCAASPLLRVPPSCPARAPLPRQVITDHLHAHIAPVPSDMLQSQTYIPAVTQAQRNGFMRG